MAFINVTGSNPGYAGRYRAGSRFWENGKRHKLEIVEDPEGGKALTEFEPIDPATGQSDMTRISKAGLAVLRADEHIAVSEYGVLSPEEIAAQAAVAAELEQSKQAEKMALDEVAVLTARVAELEAEIAALKSGGKGKSKSSDAG